MKSVIVILICFLSACKSDTAVLDRIETFSKSEDCFLCIKRLSEDTPARMSGSKNNADAISFLQSEMRRTGAEVKTDSVNVPLWLPGTSSLYYTDESGRKELNAIPLGLSVGTDGKELNLKVVEFTNKTDFEKASSLENCIVFLNEKMDTTANGYSKAGWQRMFGASMAARKGAKAVITRSLSPVSDNYPRTGTLRYEEGGKKIPALAVSTRDADILSEAIARNPNLKITLSSTSEWKGSTTGFNLIGEIKGVKNPDKVILISAHIDSWFNSQGAQDNATGCAQAVDVLRLFSEVGIKPQNTIRVLIYQDEEISMSGMKKYIENHGNESHLYNLEIDSGAEEPLGFALFETEEIYDKIKSFSDSLPFTPELQHMPLSDASFWPLSSEKKVPVYFYMAERKNYFSIHHSEVDNIFLINREVISRSSAMIAGFVYLTDRMMSAEK